MWRLLWDKPVQEGLDDEEAFFLERAEHICVAEEPDYERMWKRIRRKTAGPVRRMKIRLRIAAVVLPVAVALAAVYLFQAKARMPSQEKLVKGECPLPPAVRLTLSDGQTVMIPQDTVGKIMETKQVKVVKDSVQGLAYVASGQGNGKLRYHTLAVPVGADYRLVLSDGTVVFLNSSSRLTYPVAFAGYERRVFLEGEGYFEVHRDAEHPFRVEAAGTLVEAVGTVFNINAYPEKNGVEATLVTGKVNVVSGERRVVLSPGQQACCTERQIRVREVDCREYVSWKNGLFVFNQMTLENIMTQMQRWFGLSVFFGSDSARRYTFTGMIDKHLPAEETFRVIEKTVDVHFSLKGKTVVIQ